MCSTDRLTSAAPQPPTADSPSKPPGLNPAAVEYRGGSCTSENSEAPGSPADRSPTSTIMASGPAQRPSDFIVSPSTAVAMPRSGNGQFRPGSSQRGAGRQQAPPYGWQSPQGILGGGSPPGGVPFEGLMVPPTRQLSLRMGKDEEEGALWELLTRFGELRQLDTCQRGAKGLVVATYFDVRAAILAHDALSSPAPPAAPRSVRFVPLAQRAEGPAAGGEGEAPLPSGILAVEVEEGELSQGELGRACAALGELCGIWGSGGLFFVEYLDSRCADRALDGLEASAPGGAKLVVREAEVDPIVLLGRSPSVAKLAAAMRGAPPAAPPPPSPPPPPPADAFGGRASPPLLLPAGSPPPPMVVPVMPAYSWGAAYPVFHCYPPEAGPIERAASPPAVYPGTATPLQGSSPTLPSGFISVPVRTSSGSLYGSSPPYGASPPYGGSPIYGSSPTHHGMMFMAPTHHHPAAMLDASGAPVMMAAGGAYHGHLGHPVGPGGDLMQRMAGMGMGGGPGAAGQQGGGAAQLQDKPQRSDSRASARIARSHRAGGAYDPNDFAFNLEEAESGRPDARTTVMIRNIPNKYTQGVMLEVLEKSGFKGAFDFFYLPIDFRNKCNLGYAFLNFTSAAAAARLYRQYHSKRWEEYNSKKVCEISYARVQGRDPLIEHFRASKFPSEDIEYMPLVYTQVENGVASRPLSIHQFLAAQPGGGGGEGAAAQGEGPPADREQ